MRKIKIFIFQKIADFIVKRVENSKSEKQMKFWYNEGMVFNDYCLDREIELN